MTDRVTVEMLERKINELNLLVGANPEPYARRGVGLELRANIGTYFLSQSYGGVNVERMATEGGGISYPIVGGYMPKKILYGLLTALIRGIHIGIALDQSKVGTDQAPT